MSSLRQQVAGVIETCETVLKGRKKEDLPYVDVTTGKLAAAILKQAKEEIPGDKLLAAVELPEDKPMAVWSWSGVLAAMQSVKAALPLPGAARRQPPTPKY